MEALIDFFGNFLQDEADLRRTVTGIVAAAMFVFGIGVSVLLSTAFNPVRRRLGLLKNVERKPGTLTVKFATALGPVSEYVLPKDEKERNKLQNDLIRAGIRSPQALQAFYAIKALLVVFGFFAVIIGSRLFPDVPTADILMYAVGASAVGLLLPNYVLHKKVTARMKDLRNSFPDALDLLVVCVEAGLGLGPALQRVADELSVSHPELSFELATVNAEMRAGIPREKALRNLADRTGLQDIRGLVGLLVQALKFGTSVADSLRVYAEEFRDKRMQLAEEKAAKMSTKLIFPLVVCMFPVFFIVAIGPAVLMLLDAFITPNAGL